MQQKTEFEAEHVQVRRQVGLNPMELLELFLEPVSGKVEVGALGTADTEQLMELS